MSELDDLLIACAAAPDDDAPRLVWADAVGGERGEFVVIQCKLARDDLPPAERGALRRRCDELLATHGLAWTGLAGLPGAMHCMFRRGFVEGVQLDVVQTPWHAIFERAPLIASLNVTGLTARYDYTESEAKQGPDSIAWLAQMFQHPDLKRLRGLSLDGARVYEITGDSEWDFHSTSLADQLLELVARSGALGGMRSLAIDDTFTPRGMHELLTSNALADVEFLAFQFGQMDRAQAVELFAHAPKLRALDAHAAMDLSEMADLIPTSVVELSCFGLHADDFPALAASPVAASLERLQITGSNLAGHAKLFAAFPNLRALDVAFSSSDGLAILAATPLPRLREFRSFSDVGNPGALTLADAWGPQLERFDVIGNENVTCYDELRAKIAGDVVGGPYQWDETVLRVGINTLEPWTRYGVVIHRR